MATVFISHSSVDKPFANRVRQCLYNFGHEPWIDEMEIRAGESIPKRVADGAENCDFMLVLLTEDAIASAWVNEEWQSRLNDEVKKNRARIIPLLVKTCEIPFLLRKRKRIDFRQDFDQGLIELYHALNPVVAVGVADRSALPPPDAAEIFEQQIDFVGLWRGRWVNAASGENGTEMAVIRSQVERTITGIFFDTAQPEHCFSFTGTKKMSQLRVQYFAPAGQKIMEDGSCFLSLTANGSFRGYYAKFDACGTYTLERA